MTGWSRSTATGSTSLAGSPSSPPGWPTPIIVSGSRYLKVFDPDQAPPEERRRINVEVTRWLNECLGLNLTDAFCGFKAYRRSALEHFEITDLGYAMPLQVWVQAVQHGCRSWRSRSR